MAELGERVSSREFSLWLKAAEEDPWDEHHDFGYGQLCAAIANYAGKVLAKGAHVHPWDYMPLPKPEEKETDPMTFFSLLKDK